MAGGLLVAAVALIYIGRLDQAAGLMVDDAWYIVLAKALAQGDGFRLISSATTEILPAVPPGFPALLAAVFWVTPSYPDNLMWLKLVSVVAMLLVGSVCWLDFTRNRGVPAPHATLLVVAIVLTPSLVFLATSTVMSECVFMLAQVLAVILVERIAREDAGDNRAPIVAGILTAIVLLIRTAGAALLIAAVAYLVIAKRRRQAAIFMGAIAVCMAPWIWYAREHAPTMEERLAHGGSIAFSYEQLLTMERIDDPLAGAASTGRMARRGASNIAGVLSRDMGAILLPSIYRGGNESGQEVISIGGPRGGSMGITTGTTTISLIFSAIVLAGWLLNRLERYAMPGLLLATSLVMMAPVGGQTFRYLVPLTPFIVLFFWHGLRGNVVARIAVMCLVGFHLMDHGVYLERKVNSTTEWIDDAREMNELMSWISTHVDASGFVATTNPGLVYLATGHRSIASAYHLRNWSSWKASGIRYVVATLGGIQLPEGQLGGRLLYRTSRSGLWIVEM